jgi:hypothetical protein
MTSYFLAFTWGFVILVAWIGWGRLLNRILFPEARTDWGQSAAWGLALSVVVGGMLNVLSYISRTTVLVFLGAGLAIWLLDLLIRPTGEVKSNFPLLTNFRSSKILLVVGALIVFLASIQYAGSVSVSRSDSPSSAAGPVRFNQADDFQAYFVFPEKMLQLGSISPDPFCARQIESSLGGQSFLDALILGVLSVQNLHILDPGLGLLLIIGLLLGNFKETGTSLAWSLALLLMFVWMAPPTVNIASLYTGMALFLSLYRTLEWKAFSAGRFLSRVLIIALIAAAICSLKSTFIPACGVLLACSFVCYLVGQRFRRTALAEVVSTAALMIAFTLPWMISMYRSSRTLLYPLLGTGYHQPFHWLTISRGVQLLFKHLTDPSWVALAALGVFYLMSRRWEISGREAVLSLLIGAVVGHVVITLATGEPNNSRYSFPFIFAAVLVLITAAASWSPVAGHNKWEASRPLVAIGVTLFLVGSTWFPSRILYAECLQGVRRAIERAPLVQSPEIAAYQRLQESVPRGEVILTRLEKPFLLDFKRNTVFVVDYAVASPPPGMPLREGGEALARYLTSHSTRYVAYSYTGEAARRAVVGHDQYSPFTLNQIERTFDFEDDLEQLSKTRRRVYDDGRSFVLDLSQPGSGSEAISVAVQAAN